MITTRRFIMRDFEAADRRAFHAYHADPRYRALFGSAEAEHRDAQQLLVLFGEWADERPRRSYQLAVVRRDARAALIGCCGLRRASENDSTAEMGIELAPDYWGCFGYAIEISCALMEIGFGELGLSEICGSTHSANTRVARLAEWFGATVVASRPGPPWMRAEDWTEIEWRVRRENWRGSKAARRFGGTVRRPLPFTEANPVAPA